MRSTEQLLRDILSYLRDIEAFTIEGRGTFMRERKTHYAVVRAYEVIGEIVKRLPAELLATQPGIAWQDIKEFRDFLAHNYDRIRLDVVWDAVDQLPQLKAAIEVMLASLRDGKASDED